MKGLKKKVIVSVIAAVTFVIAGCSITLSDGTCYGIGCPCGNPMIPMCGLNN